MASLIFSRAFTRVISIDLAYCSITPAQTLALTTACCKGLRATLVETNYDNDFNNGEFSGESKYDPSALFSLFEGNQSRSHTKVKKCAAK